MKRQIPMLAAFGLLLCLNGCLTRNESAQYPELVGKTFAVVRPCYVVQDLPTTSSFLGTSRKPWWLVEETDVERILATTGSAELRAAYATRRPVPVGTTFTVRRIMWSYESGSYAIGTVHLSGQSLECIVTIAGAGGEPLQTPWDVSPPPSRATISK